MKSEPEPDKDKRSVSQPKKSSLTTGFYLPNSPASNTTSSSHYLSSGTHISTNFHSYRTLPFLALYIDIRLILGFLIARADSFITPSLQATNRERTPLKTNPPLDSLQFKYRPSPSQSSFYNNRTSLSNSLNLPASSARSFYHHQSEASVSKDDSEFRDITPLIQGAASSSYTLSQVPLLLSLSPQCTMTYVGIFWNEFAVHVFHAKIQAISQ